MPVTDHGSLLISSLLCFSCSSLSLSQSFLILSLQCCLACFALLFHLISYSRSFSQNPCCLFLNLSIFPSLSLLHICVSPHVPWCFYETFTCELQKGCGQNIPEGGGVEALIRKAGSQRGPQPSWDISWAICLIPHLTTVPCSCMWTAAHALFYLSQQRACEINSLLMHPMDGAGGPLWIPVPASLHQWWLWRHTRYHFSVSRAMKWQTDVQPENKNRDHQEQKHLCYIWGTKLIQMTLSQTWSSVFLYLPSYGQK